MFYAVHDSWTPYILEPTVTALRINLSEFVTSSKFNLEMTFDFCKIIVIDEWVWRRLCHKCYLLVFLQSNFATSSVNVLSNRYSLFMHIVVISYLNRSGALSLHRFSICNVSQSYNMKWGYRKIMAGVLTKQRTHYINIPTFYFLHYFDIFTLYYFFINLFLLFYRRIFSFLLHGYYWYL